MQTYLIMLLHYTFLSFSPNFGTAKLISIKRSKMAKYYAGFFYPKV